MIYLFNFVRIGVSALFVVMLYKHYGIFLAAAFSFIYIQVEFVLFFSSNLFNKAANMAKLSKEFNQLAADTVEKMEKDILTRMRTTEDFLRKLIEAINGM